MQNRQFKKGFTLIELLIVIFILTVGIVAILQAFPLGMQVIRSGRMTTIAVQLGQAKIEETISELYSEISPGTTTEDYEEIPNFTAYKRVIKVACLNPDLEEVACDYDPSGNPDPVKKIEVTMFWKSPLGVSEKNINLISSIAKQ